ncbi:hypothetical protein ACFW9X_35720, partial [Streptomyces sp. NPDC059466]
MDDHWWTLSASLLGLAQWVEPLARLRAAGAKVIHSLREETGAPVSLVVPSQDAFALEMIPGRETLPIDARNGASLAATTPPGDGAGGGHPAARAPAGARRPQ